MVVLRTVLAEIHSPCRHKHYGNKMCFNIYDIQYVNDELCLKIFWNLDELLASADCSICYSTGLLSTKCSSFFEFREGECYAQ